MSYRWLAWLTAGLAAVALWNLGSRSKAGEQEKTGNGSHAVQANGSISQSRPQRQSLEVRRLAGQVAALQAQMAQLHTQMAQSSIPSELTEQAQESDTPVPRDANRQHEKWHTHMLEVASNFQSEDIVPLWANRMSSKLKDVFVNTEMLRSLNPEI